MSVRPTVFIPLADRPFRKFLAETKTVELRSLDSPVARRVLKFPDTDSAIPATLSRGYGKAWRLDADIGGVYEFDRLEKVSDDLLRRADLDADSSPYFDRSKPLLALDISSEPGTGGFPFQSYGWAKPLPPVGNLEER